MIQSLLLENNLQIYNELLELTCHDNIKFEKDISKNYFSIFINNKYYSILSDYYDNNNIKLDIIGEDKQKYVTILETLQTSCEIFNYFYDINYKHSTEKIEYVIDKPKTYNKNNKYYNKNNKYYNKNKK